MELSGFSQMVEASFFFWVEFNALLLSDFRQVVEAKEMLIFCMPYVPLDPFPLLVFGEVSVPINLLNILLVSSFVVSFLH